MELLRRRHCLTGHWDTGNICVRPIYGAEMLLLFPASVRKGTVGAAEKRSDYSRSEVSEFRLSRWPRFVGDPHSSGSCSLQSRVSTVLIKYL
jgi:hypothetical protein